MKCVYKLVMAALLGIFLFSGWKVVTLGMQYLNSGESYEALGQYVFLQSQSTRPMWTVLPAQESRTSEPGNEEILRPRVDFDGLAEINPDIVGWIYLEDSKINYPIVFRDNEFYLSHLFTGEYNSGGCIFLDARNETDFSDAHSILYGHHMKDGSMFAGIAAYRDQAFYDSHPTGLLQTPDGTYEIRFFSGYVADTRESAWNLAFSEEEYGTWLDEIIRKSYFHAEITPTLEDRILTLSTCTYDFENARFVLHGVIVEADIQ